MIPRQLEPKLRELAGYYPVVAVTGPRQSGKTTLCRSVFPDHSYVSLEALDARDFARNDPRAFLAQHAAGAVIDEVQNAPGLLSYLQTEVDERPQSGRFILTGSQHFGLSQAISQSLAGRCGVLTLLPPAWAELRAFANAPLDLMSALWQGSYPRIYDRGIPAHQWLADYLATYIQRDVRQVLNVGDLHGFSTFLRLCAGRTGQELNLSTLGADAGVSHNTARAWLSVLESSYLLLRVPGWHPTLRKQLVKTPKLHFLDSGLVCHLLGIRDPQQLWNHPLRGAVFESWVVAEIYKTALHAGDVPRLFHYRESRGLEIDLLVEYGESIDAFEIKSSTTVLTEHFRNLERFPARLHDAGVHTRVNPALVYAGDENLQRTAGRQITWRDVGAAVR